MMIQSNEFSFALIDALGASVLELSYGKEDRLSMLLLLPKLNILLTDVINKLKDFDISRILYELHKYDSTESAETEEIVLSLPRFRIDSHLDMRTFLENLGIIDIFNPEKAKLRESSSTIIQPKVPVIPLHVSHVFHRTIIEVNEVGTNSVAESDGLSFKRSPKILVVNRPFAYLIVNRITNTLLFTGLMRNPLL